jgi:hypothetical protein|uniref:Uncharacterized protein n=1 Tax=Zea mays TaxID=4577 RepID=A0A804QJI3_MAIZE
MGVPAVELESLGSITTPTEGRRIRKGDGVAPSGRGRSTRACPASCSGSPWAGPSACSSTSAHGWMSGGGGPRRSHVQDLRPDPPVVVAAGDSHLRPTCSYMQTSDSPIRSAAFGGGEEAGGASRVRVAGVSWGRESAFHVGSRRSGFWGLRSCGGYGALLALSFEGASNLRTAGAMGGCARRRLCSGAGRGLRGPQKSKR